MPLELKPVTADAKTTALLMLDFVNPNCTNRPRCVASKILKDKAIQSVTGTAAHGAVLYTRSGAALRGMQVIVPVDGMTSEDLYYEQASAWLLTKGAGGIGPKVTLTRSFMIKF